MAEKMIVVNRRLHQLRISYAAWTAFASASAV